MLRHEKASQINIVILKWGRTHTIRRNSMPFIVYFFLSLLVIYIPLPTFFLLVNRLAEQRDTITALTKLCLLLYVCLDYFTSYYWLKQTRVKKRYISSLSFSISLSFWSIAFYFISIIRSICGSSGFSKWSYYFVCSPFLSQENLGRHCFIKRLWKSCLIAINKDTFKEKLLKI